MMETIRQPSLVARLRPRHLAELPLAARMSVVKQQRRRELKRREREFSGPDPVEQAIFERLQSDPEFYRQFDVSPWRNPEGRRPACRRGRIEGLWRGGNLTANGGHARVVGAIRPSNDRFVRYRQAG